MVLFALTVVVIISSALRERGQDLGLRTSNAAISGIKQFHYVIEL